MEQRAAMSNCRSATVSVEPAVPKDQSSTRRTTTGDPGAPTATWTSPVVVRIDIPVSVWVYTAVSTRCWWKNLDTTPAVLPATTSAATTDPTTRSSVIPAPGRGGWGGVVRKDSGGSAGESV